MQGVVQAVPCIVNAGGQVNVGSIALVHLIFLRLHEYADENHSAETKPMPQPCHRNFVPLAYQASWTTGTVRPG